VRGPGKMMDMEFMGLHCFFFWSAFTTQRGVGTFIGSRSVFTYHDTPHWRTREAFYAQPTYSVPDHGFNKHKYITWLFQNDVVVLCAVTTYI
jgi:hypothetical protein